MDIFLIVLGILLILIGLLGSVLPIIPGPPLSFLGLLVIHRTAGIQFSPTLLWILGGFAVLTVVLDYFIPVWGTKKFGGSKAGTWGSFGGLVIGLFFFPPFGAIVGPLVGAFVGEYIVHQNRKDALRSTWGSFLGFLLGTGMKIIVCGVMLWYAIKASIALL